MQKKEMKVIPFNPKKGIKDVDDYAELANEYLEEFIEGLVEGGGYITEPHPNDHCPDEVSYFYTDKAVSLIDKYKTLLYQIGQNHFPDEDWDLIYIEPPSYLYQDF
jgi:hypothetical protein